MTEQNGVGRSSATEILRRLLDERGVKWMPVAWNPKRETFYHAANGVGFCADEYTDGVRIYTDATITPEQAIAATLGRGECRNKSKWTNVFNCSACGFEYDFVTDPYQGPRYCPNCGRRIETVDE